MSEASDRPASADQRLPRLSDIVPVYNERYLVAGSLRRLAGAPLPSAGSRFHYSARRRVLYYRHQLVNRLISFPRCRC